GFTTLQILGTFSGADQPGPTITSVFVNQHVSIDPNSSLWDDAPSATVSLNGQNITIPILFNPTVTSINVRSMNNGTWIGFWLEWADPTESSAALATHQFRDSIGVVFPTTDAKTFIAMGGPNTPVNIMHWKADWQKDIDLNRYQDREDAYPNMALDLYLGADEEKGEVLNYDPKTQDPSEMGTGDPRIPVTELNIDYQPGMAAGAFGGDYWLDKISPIEELVAEGFGTLTTQEQQNTLGKGVYENGIWKVVMLRPMLTGDMTDKQFEPGEKTNIAFAIWDGGNEEVNGRKSVALWHNFEVEQGVVGQEPLVVPPAAEGASMMVVSAIIIGVAAVAAAVIFYFAKRRAPSITR
ncbi:MAG: ethylbenzene dehydrogenase-related protein, partial [Nitrososphaerales archaeon]